MERGTPGTWGHLAGWGHWDSRTRGACDSPVFTGITVLPGPSPAVPFHSWQALAPFWGKPFVLSDCLCPQTPSPTTRPCTWQCCAISPTCWSCWCTTVLTSTAETGYGHAQPPGLGCSAVWGQPSCFPRVLLPLSTSLFLLSAVLCCCGRRSALAEPLPWGRVWEEAGETLPLGTIKALQTLGVFFTCFADPREQSPGPGQRGARAGAVPAAAAAVGGRCQRCRQERSVRPTRAGGGLGQGTGLGSFAAAPAPCSRTGLGVGRKLGEPPCARYFLLVCAGCVKRAEPGSVQSRAGGMGLCLCSPVVLTLKVALLWHF